MSIFIRNFFLPILVAFVTYYAFGLREEYKKRKIYSLLGVELLTILIKEVEVGYKIIIEPIQSIHFDEQPNPLPNKCWNGINTISSEILLRVFEVSKGIPDKGHPAKEIRIHTKNYYEYYIGNWEMAVRDVWIVPLDAEKIETINEFKINYGTATKNVLLMLYHIRTLLEKNAEKRFPK